MEKCVILSARAYDFEDARNQHIKGVSLTYLTGDSEDSDQRRGVFPMTVSATSDVFRSITALPGVYELDFKQRPGRQGKPSLAVVGARLCTPLTSLLQVIGE